MMNGATSANSIAATPRRAPAHRSVRREWFIEHDHLHTVDQLRIAGDRRGDRGQVGLGIGECVLNDLARGARSRRAVAAAGDGGDIRVACRRESAAGRPAAARLSFAGPGSSIELSLSGAAGVIPAATVWPVLPKRLAALAPATSAESIINCQPVSIASIASDMNARPTSANSIATAPDVLRAFTWRTLS